jgi:ribonuclease E
MLETERYDKEPGNDDGAAAAGHSAEITGNPAEAGPASDATDPGSKDAGTHGRRLFRRGRRAATRPAGPPASDADQAGGESGGPADSGEPDGAAAAPQGPAAQGAPAQGAAAQDAAPQGSAPQGSAPRAARSRATGSQGSRSGGSGSGGSGSRASAARTAAPETPPEVPRVPPAPQATQTAAAPPPASSAPQAAFQAPLVIFQPPDISSSSAVRRPAGPPSEVEEPAADGRGSFEAGEPDDDAAEAGGGSPAKRRRRGGRGKGRAADGAAGDGQGADGDRAADAEDDSGPARPSGKAEKSDGGEAAKGSGDDSGDDGDDEAGDGPGGSARRRRRRRRSGHSGDGESLSSDDPPNTVVHVRPPRAAGDDSSDVRDVRGVKGSTRLEAKRQRRREGRESGRRRPPIITESEFLARREAVERVMVVRQRGDRTQIAVLEDGILVEHYVDKASHQSYVGNVYLGRVQNVLPSMEAAFVDIGKGRNAVLYAGEVNFDASGLEGESKRIESALKSGQSILVQATKDPIGHKGARLTSQVSLPGRYLVYVPGASMTGISRKLPDTERTRLKQILKQVMPEDAGVIVRTAAEGATEEELSHDVARLAAQWEAIERKSKSASAPELLYSEPDLTIRVVRDIFNEDFSKLVIASDGDWDMVDEYVRYVAPNLAERLERWTDDDGDVFAAYRIDEQIAKALERKVWLPSGGSLVIDATEAMTVIDVNTGKFTGQGGNLEQTVTRNNLEAAEEIVRQLRVRDVGGIIVIDFIDMVLESNRDLVLRRLLECLARDRTKHQVAEVTSLGLVQMTRKRVGSGLLEAFSVPCEHCNGRGVIVSLELGEHVPAGDRHVHNGSGRDGSGRDGGRDGSGRDGGRGGSSRGGRGRGSSGGSGGSGGSGSGGPGGSGSASDAPDASVKQDEAARGSADGGPAAEGGGSRSSGRRRRRGSDSRASGQAQHADAPDTDTPDTDTPPAEAQGAADGHLTADAPPTEPTEAHGAAEAQPAVDAPPAEARAAEDAHTSRADVPMGGPEAAPAYIQEHEEHPAATQDAGPGVTHDEVVTHGPVVTPDPIVAQDPVVTPDPVVAHDPVVTQDPVVTTDAAVLDPAGGHGENGQGFDAAGSNASGGAGSEGGTPGSSGESGPDGTREAQTTAG